MYMYIYYLSNTICLHIVTTMSFVQKPTTSTTSANLCVSRLHDRGAGFHRPNGTCRQRMRHERVWAPGGFLGKMNADSAGQMVAERPSF